VLKNKTMNKELRFKKLLNVISLQEDPEALTLRKREPFSQTLAEQEENNIENTKEPVSSDIPETPDVSANVDLNTTGDSSGEETPLPDSNNDMNLDDEIGVGSGGGSSLGNLGGGGGSGAGFSDDNQGSEKQPKQDDQETDRPLKDQLVDKIIKGDLITAPPSDVFNAIRAAYFEIPDVKTNWEEIKKQIEDNGSQTAKDGLKRFEKYLTINEKKEIQMKEVELTENQIVQLTKTIAQKLIKEYSDESINLAVEPSSMPKPVERGSRTFMAQRKLTISAQQAAFEFEAEIRSELSLKDPNEMPAGAQKIYQTAMEMMHTQVISATTKAIEAIKDLPRIEKANKN
jgi:hypothetical protein